MKKDYQLKIIIKGKQGSGKSHIARRIAHLLKDELFVVRVFDGETKLSFGIGINKSMAMVKTKQTKK